MFGTVRNAFPEPARPFDVVAIGASLGGPGAIGEILSVLPRDFPVPILIAQHRPPYGHSVLSRFLSRTTRLPVREAEAGEPAIAGVVYVAPANRHLVLTRRLTLALSDGPKVCHVRPSVDVLFRSIADAAGPRALGVVLTGMGRDGAEGAVAIRETGGTIIAQCDETARAPSMPRSVVAQRAANLVVSLPYVASSLISLAMVPGAAESLGVPFPAR